MTLDHLLHALTRAVRDGADTEAEVLVYDGMGGGIEIADVIASSDGCVDIKLGDPA